MAVDGVPKEGGVGVWGRGRHTGRTCPDSPPFPLLPVCPARSLTCRTLVSCLAVSGWQNWPGWLRWELAAARATGEGRERRRAGGRESALHAAQTGFVGFSRSLGWLPGVAGARKCVRLSIGSQVRAGSGRVATLPERRPRAPPDWRRLWKGRCQVVLQSSKWNAECFLSLRCQPAL